MNASSKLVCFASLAFTLAASMSAAFGADRFTEQERDWHFMRQPSGPLVAAVREAAGKYQDVSRAEADGYTRMFGCVSGAEEGAMGVHYMNFALMGDAVLDATKPEMLVYEPLRDGGLRLAAVEYFVDAALWDSLHDPADPPILMGQLYDYMGAPNRFHAGANYSLHVWAWKYNPKGVFSMWNPRVSCSAYSG